VFDCRCGVPPGGRFAGSAQWAPRNLTPSQSSANPWEAFSAEVYRHFPVLPARGPDCYFNVLSERGEEFH
jgi:hypothetical protein